MDVIANFVGVGTVVVEGKDAGSARYEIVVKQGGNWQCAEGTISADMKLLSVISGTGSCTLILETGEAVTALVENWVPGTEAAFAVIGEYPRI
jgi:hypothetical protein